MNSLFSHISSIAPFDAFVMNIGENEVEILNEGYLRGSKR